MHQALEGSSAQRHVSLVSGAGERLSRPDADDRPPWGNEVTGAACAIERSDGVMLAARLLSLDGARREISYRLPNQTAQTVLPMDQLRLLTLTAILPRHGTGAASYRQPGRDCPVLQVYELNFLGSRRCHGVTLGRAERSHGHFLLRPSGKDGGAVRVFVPRRAGIEVSFHDDRRGRPRQDPPDAGDLTRCGPVRDEAQLRLALLDQARAPLRLTGEVLIDMGLVTNQQVAEVLAGQAEDPGLPVGERLVAAGYLSSADLRMALRRKLGYPLVDLRHFPLNPALLRKLSAPLAAQWEVLPVMQVDQGVAVAMARLDDLQVLEELRFVFQAPILPVLPWGEPMALLVAAAYARHRLSEP